DTDLAQIDRGLYGANLHFETEATTSFGEKTFAVDSFAAEPGTLAGRDEFRGTGGSLYFLRHQDIMVGSDRIRIEVRDKDSGIVIGTKNLTTAIDYDIDYIQGRILLSEPLLSTATDNLLVDSGSISGHPVYLVVRYEFTPGFDELDNIALGGRAHYWIGDSVKLGVTSSKQDEDDNESTLNGMDITWRQSAGSWVKLESSTTEGPGSDILNSSDGGFSFDTTQLSGDYIEASAQRLEASLQLKDVVENAQGNATFYMQQREAGFSAPGQLTEHDTDQLGATLTMPIIDKLKLNIKADKKDQQDALSTGSLELNADYQLTDNWKLSAGNRVDSRDDNSAVVPDTQEQGVRSDVAFQAHYDSKENWTGYGFTQMTANVTGNREENNRIGVGGSYRATEKLKLDGELSSGDLGKGVKLGTDYLMSDRTNLYLNYALENERADNGVRSRKGNMASGVRSRYSDSASVYAEERYAHGDVPTGLTHAMGVDLAPNDRWNIGAKIEMGTLEDQTTAATTERQAIGFTLGYGIKNIKYTGALEYRDDLSQNSSDSSESERKTWLMKNSFKYQMNEDWRILGKLNHSDSSSSEGEFYDGKFTEAVFGYAYRPIKNDKLNALFKYTYFYNVPTTEQTVVENTSTEYIQKSNIYSVDVLYDLSQRWTLGAKYAFRQGELSLDRIDPEFFDSRASLYVLRADWHFTHRWDILIEARKLALPDAQDERSGALIGIYRHLGKNVKFGVGYNFTDFSDDLTDLDYDSQGFFINIIAKM
ncbi:MAG: flagellar motor protein MotB, partial [Gammaproteobacteria bacterium]|nr:flagellar motor protein MotB [Gammaproteobacteria bacterium]